MSFEDGVSGKEMESEDEVDGGVEGRSPATMGAFPVNHCILQAGTL